MKLARQAIAAVISVGVFLTTLASAQAYRCEGETHEHCCCAGDHDEPANAPSIERTCCCELIEGAAPTSHRAPVVDAPSFAPVMVAVALVTEAPPPSRITPPAPPPRAGAPPPRELYARHCSFLL